MDWIVAVSPFYRDSQSTWLWLPLSVCRRYLAPMKMTITAGRDFVNIFVKVILHQRQVVFVKLSPNSGHGFIQIFVRLVSVMVDWLLGKEHANTLTSLIMSS